MQSLIKTAIVLPAQTMDRQARPHRPRDASLP
jgi:hypothetical protein